MVLVNFPSSPMRMLGAGSPLRATSTREAVKVKTEVKEEPLPDPVVKVVAVDAPGRVNGRVGVLYGVIKGQTFGADVCGLRGVVEGMELPATVLYSAQEDGAYAELPLLEGEDAPASAIVNRVDDDETHVRVRLDSLSSHHKGAYFRVAFAGVDVGPLRCVSKFQQVKHWEARCRTGAELDAAGTCRGRRLSRRAAAAAAAAASAESGDDDEYGSETQAVKRRRKATAPLSAAVERRLRAMVAEMRSEILAEVRAMMSSSS